MEKLTRYLYEIHRNNIYHETHFDSGINMNISDIYMLLHYDKQVIKFIMEDFKEKNYLSDIPFLHLIGILTKITNEDPVLHESIGFIDEMLNDWIKWYDKKMIKQ